MHSMASDNAAAQQDCGALSLPPAEDVLLRRHGVDDITACRFMKRFEKRL